MGAVMGAKRALIVDDSKSARLFLGRLLEKYELDVDNAENAESAIEYLTTHRPDVILLCVGANDLAAGASAEVVSGRLGSLLDAVTARDPPR